MDRLASCYSFSFFVVSCLRRGLDKRSQKETVPKRDQVKRVGSSTMEKERGCNPEIVPNSETKRGC